MQVEAPLCRRLFLGAWAIDEFQFGAEGWCSAGLSWLLGFGGILAIYR